MNRFAAFFLCTALCVFAAPDDDAISALAGVYSRADGKKEERLRLDPDRTYIFSTKVDIGSDEETGLWAVRDGHVLLEPKKFGAVVKKKPSRFLILALHADPLLRVVNESSSEALENDPRFYFWREHAKG